MMAEVYREKTPIAATLLAVLLLLLVSSVGRVAVTPVAQRMPAEQMSITAGKGWETVGGIALVAAGVVAVGLAVTCLAVPFAAPLIITATFGSLGTAMAASGTMAVGVGLMGVSGVAGIAGGMATIATDQ